MEKDEINKNSKSTQNQNSYDSKNKKSKEEKTESKSSKNIGHNNINENNENLFSDYSSSPSRSDSYKKRRSRSLSRSRSRSRSPNTRRRYENKNEDSFVMKNGCCRDCMRAFSKNGKSCLCQVPKYERKITMSDNGCNFCGCHGCNPIDQRRESRRQRKKLLREDKNIMYKNQRLLDSDDEDLKIFQVEVDDWNYLKMDLFKMMKNYLRTNPSFMGIGVPNRTPSYILGYSPNKSKNSNEDRQRRKKY